MNISKQEALSILNTWKDKGAELRIHKFQSGKSQEFRGQVARVARTVVEVNAGSDGFQIDIDPAEFNGDKAAPPSSPYDAYLVCEFRNGDRCSFYADRRKTARG